MRIKKNEEKKLAEKVKKDQKEVERRAEITKQRRKFDSTYVFSKTPFEKSSTTVKHNDVNLHFMKLIKSPIYIQQSLVL